MARPDHLHPGSSAGPMPAARESAPGRATPLTLFDPGPPIHPPDAPPVPPDVARIRRLMDRIVADLVRLRTEPTR